MSEQPLPFFARLGLAFACFFRVLFNGAFAAGLKPSYQRLSSGAPTLPEPSAPQKPADEHHASALFILSALQREGRFIDFLQEEVAPFTDDQVGAAARVVHAGCRKVLKQYLTVEPVMRESEGARVTVPAGFDADRIRLTGNVSGQPPFSGALKHHGWVTRQVTLPELSSALDPKVLAPAEVELS